MPRTEASPSPAVAPPPGNPRFPLFDALRAMAALSVLVYHVGFYSRANEGESGLSPYLARLNVGVAVFFVISGFLLYRPLLAARVQGTPPIRLRDYARRRVLRIVPAYWVALTVLAIYPGLTGVFGGDSWIYYAFGQDYGNSTVTGGIGPAWSLGCEVVFYALLPLLSLGLGWVTARRGRRSWWQIELALLAFLALASAGLRLYARHHPSFPQSTFATTFAWFALGMALAVMSVWADGAGRRASTALRRYSWTGWVVAASAYLVICRGLGLGGAFVFLQSVTVGQDLGVYALSGVVAVGLALPAAFEPERRNPVTRVLSLSSVGWLGIVSYAIYLYHEPIARKLSGGVAHSSAHAAVRFLWLLPATLAITVAVAAISYQLVERPFLRLKDRRLSRRRLEPQPVPEHAA
jgi:peptidoglycan/LPS O-acetylase OafA/YrhL